jgi:hypothetical protein
MEHAASMMPVMVPPTRGPSYYPANLQGVPCDGLTVSTLNLQPT